MKSKPSSETPWLTADTRKFVKALEKQGGPPLYKLAIPDARQVLLDAQSGKIKAEFDPMGTFIERIRCGGMGLGGVLTRTGLGTVVQEGKQVIHVNGQDYLLETALRADVAITRCRRADPFGNMAFRGSTGRASHPVIATCGDLSIAEVDHFCDLGEISPEEVEVAGMFVDMLLV